jgi:hypothetical protein
MLKSVNFGRPLLIFKMILKNLQLITLVAISNVMFQRM